MMRTFATPLEAAQGEDAYICRPLGGDAQLCTYATSWRRHRKMMRTYATPLEAAQEMMRTYAALWVATHALTDLPNTPQRLTQCGQEVKAILPAYHTRSQVIFDQPAYYASMSSPLWLCICLPTYKPHGG